MTPPREHAFFPLEPLGFLVADPFDDVIEVAYRTDVHALSSTCTIDHRATKCWQLLK